MGTPSSVALVTLALPGASPTTTAVVFFDTLPGALPPRDVMASSAPSRLKPSSVPVTTIDVPASVCGAVGSSTRPKSTPAARSFSMTARWPVVVEPRRAPTPAMVGPTPSARGELVG